MKNIVKIGQRHLIKLFDTRAAGLYLLLFATSIGAATFIENDFGTSAAQKVVYKSWWFELLLILFGITILINVIRFRMVQQKKWALLIFHTAIVVILIGAGITRYFGYEGTMHIRENDVSNSFLSAETHLIFEVIKDNQKYRFSESALFASLGNNAWNESFLIGDDLLEVEVKAFVPNPIEEIDESPNGAPTIKIVIGGAAGREEYFLKEGKTKRIRNLLYNFSDHELSDAINIQFRNDSLLLKTNRVLTQTIMANQERDTLLPGPKAHMLRLRALYSDGENNFVFGDFGKKGVVVVRSEDAKVRGESMTGLRMNVSVNGEEKEAFVQGRKGSPGQPFILRFDDLSLAISYGAKPIYLPFSVKLYDFMMERYPGTNNAASYASEVQLIDERNGVEKDYRIFMNNILDYDGYRFFQSSFDKDEKGTYLSVNHDFLGTWVSYIGYFLLTLGLVASLFSKKSRFHYAMRKIRELRAGRNALLILIITMSAPLLISAQKIIDPSRLTNIIDTDHAAKFQRLVVQDHNGRMKPIHTLTREVMRKLARKESLYGLTADQIVLGMHADSRDWNGVPMIKIGKHQKLHQLLGVNDELASYNDFFSTSGTYILRDEVRRAYGLQPIDRGVYEKELMKVDERVNIASMVYSGRILKIIPIPDDPNHTWVSNHLQDHGLTSADQPVAEKFFRAYTAELRNAMKAKSFGLANQMVEELDHYQQSNGGVVMPSPSKVNAEIFLNNLGVFSKLSMYYMILGILFLLALFLSIFNPSLRLNSLYKLLFGLVILGFSFHTLGLGLRWYVSGRAPWSNGYESMIYIAWTTTLAGILFTRRSFGGLAATMVLAATVLLVASLSYLDPEITPLVPVLRSYWLTIHVSLEAGSYGFLMLGALIGLINLVLMIFLTTGNEQRIYRIIREMSYISEITLVGGLIMVSVGTYLGGIWANESWGRYWGWDAKETWALVTILVYAFILHMRLIPKLTGLYAYNVATLFGWASVIMTYYGVNYYLSGLHSYAAGDPVPIPKWVYIAVIAVVIISIAAYMKKRKYSVVT